MRTLACTLALALAAGHAAGANGNRLRLSNGAETVFVFSDPSVGGASGAPDLEGDLWWQAFPAGTLVMADGTATLEGLGSLFVGTTDWSSQPVVFDLGIGRAVSELGGDGTSSLLPLALFEGLGSLEAIVSIGPSGLPNPCTLPMPMAGCVTDGVSGLPCAPPVTGYDVTVEFGSPIQIAADGYDGTAVVAFAPGGMVYDSAGAGNCDRSFPDPSSGGFLSLGNYDFTGSFSSDENQADQAPPGSGYSLVAGLQRGDDGRGNPTGPHPLARNRSGDVALQITEPVCQAIVEDFAAAVPYPAESGTASLLLDVSSGGARVGVRVSSMAHEGMRVFPVISDQLWRPPGPPGIHFPVRGMSVLVRNQGPIYRHTLQAWKNVGPLLGVDRDGDGTMDEVLLETPLETIPPELAGETLYLQAFVLTGTNPLAFDETSVFSVHLH